MSLPRPVIGDCTTCSGRGVYRDRQCRERTCAHRLGRILKTRETRVATPYGERSVFRDVRSGKRVMACPQRICLCAAGRAWKRALREQEQPQGVPV